MMIIRLFCPRCAHSASQGLKGFTTIEVPVPVVQLAENGLYKVVCEKGHESMVALLNLKFELLFEIGLNAIIDGYSREAVTSFASSLERFYEFYWRVVMHKFAVSETEVAGAWKAVGRLSERQIGAYISASLMLTSKAPSLLNANKEVPFRNNVIHNGYVPNADEAISFGDVVMTMINDDLSKLREFAPESLEAVYSSLLPKNDEKISKSETELCGGVNVLTALDVMHPPSAEHDDTRVGGVADQFARILHDREPHRMHLFQSEAEKEEYGVVLPKRR